MTTRLRGSFDDLVSVANKVAGGAMNRRCGAMHNVFLGITFAGALALVLASLVALQRIIE
jgi:hypothetical protein